MGSRVFCHPQRPHLSASEKATPALTGLAALQRSAGNRAVAGMIRGSGKFDPSRDMKAPGAAADGLMLDGKGDGHDLVSPRFAGNNKLEAAFDNETVVERGSKGDAVRALQQGLTDFGFRPQGVDGDFGPNTKAAVRSFQAEAGLTMDGRVGRQTMTALDARGVQYAGPGSALAPRPSPAAPPGSISVQVPPNIRAASTPVGMGHNRIPPRVDTEAVITVTGLSIPMAPVTLSIAGASAANGTATINGAATADLMNTATVQLRGGTQTTPGNGGNLALVASQNGTELTRSAPFSVSSVPQFYTDVFVRDVVGAARGFVVQDGWESDSGNIADLDQADISEQVETTTATGCFSGVVGGVSGYLPANSFTTDTHSTAVAVMTTPGRRIAQQTCMFRDKRSGANDIPMRDSGFELDRKVFNAGGGVRRLLITKKGKATTANTIPSGAGVGDITRNQVV